MDIPEEPRNSDEIPLSDWEDEHKDAPLGPADILQGFEPLSAITGEPPFIFANKAYNLGAYENSIIMEVSAQSMIDLLRSVFSHNGEDKGLLGVVTSMVSDGNTSHAITPQDFLADDPNRLRYFDPWNVSSFLEKGKNIANIEARREGKGTYSITVDEFRRILVACGFMGLRELDGLDYRLSLDELRSSEFYSFFHIRETSLQEKEIGRKLLTLKTGGFQQFVDIQISVDQYRKIYEAMLTIARQWIDQPANIMFAIDIVKSFIDAMVPRQVDLSRLGVANDPVIPNPDRKMADFLIETFWDLPDPQKTEAKLADSKEFGQIAYRFLMTFLGKESSATAWMLFSKLNVRNEMAGNREVFKVSVDTEFQPFKQEEE